MLPLQGKIFTTFLARVLQGMGIARGQEDEISAGGGVVLSIDIHLYVTGAHQDNFFGPVDMRQVADFSGIEGGGMHVYFGEPGCRLAEDLAAFAFGGMLNGHGGPVEEEGVMAEGLAGAVVVLG